MHQPESRKYQLFPKGNQTATKVLDPEQAFAHAMSQSSKTEKSDKLAAASNGLRIRIKEHNLTRRRKISVPDLGPMTTVQEVAMDSRKCILLSNSIASCHPPRLDTNPRLYSYDSWKASSPRAIR